MKNKLVKFARLDTATGKGMNEGFCVNDGEAYFENEPDLIAYLRADLIEGVVMSDKELLEDAYDNETYYYTEWDADDEDTYFIKVKGEWLEVINNKVN